MASLWRQKNSPARRAGLRKFWDVAFTDPLEPWKGVKFEKHDACENEASGTSGI